MWKMAKAIAPKAQKKAITLKHRPRFNSLIDKTQFITTTATTISSFILSAISTPNSILAENTQLDDNFKDGTDALNHETTRPNDQLDISNLCLPQRLIQTLHTRGITNIFTIQRAVLVSALEVRDIIARVKNRTGKALAFGIPIIKRLTEQTSSQILIMPHIMGFVYHPANALSRGVHIVVGTPGRTIELLEGGYGNYFRKSTIKAHQSMFFSATLTSWVKKLARKYLDSPLQIDLYLLALGEKWLYLQMPGCMLRIVISFDLSAHEVASSEKGTFVSGKTIVFTQTKQDADGVTMTIRISIASEAFRGDISQHQRERTLNGFRQGKFPVLVATNIASHGLHIPNVDLVSVVPSEMLLFIELSDDPGTFVHRCGRTDCAGKEGNVILMFTSNQRSAIRSLERVSGCKFEFVNPPAIEEVLESSAEQMVAALDGV
ncbi:hypothetical protein POTOM_037168 [Populus tomentosa]|uniref:Helicase C-terminal domain-containing protein n=1 Tax=Populus tomentosa TaxID=118781 RepID=A0A8X7YYI9_POPTO|nr:hypothetical protein POTOM_037168 [Populus tomentosa]